MENEIIKVGNEEFTVYTEKSTTVAIGKPLYDLISVDEYGYNTCCETHTVGSYLFLQNILEQIEDDGLEEYAVSKEDMDFLRTCIKLLKSQRVDRITFELCL